MNIDKSGFCVCHGKFPCPSWVYLDADNATVSSDMERVTDTLAIQSPVYKSKLIIGPENGGLRFMFKFERPNWFWRKMQYLFFGFVWKEVEK